MSLAWATVALVLLLLPGVLFFIGLYIPERFTRDTAPKSALGQLAGAVSLSLLIHGSYFSLQGSLCGGILPCVRTSYLLGLLQVGRPGEIPLAALATNISEYRWFIFLYLFVSALIGLILGWRTGAAVVRGGWNIFSRWRLPMRWLAQHDWVLDLREDSDFGYTYAYILTRVSHEERRLVYQGILSHFALTSTGQFSYLVLSEAERSYLRMGEQEAAVDKESHLIGSSSQNPSDRERLLSYLVLDGADIENVVFDTFEIKVDPGERENLQRLLVESVHKSISAILNENYPRRPRSRSPSTQHATPQPSAPTDPPQSRPDPSDPLPLPE